MPEFLIINVFFVISSVTFPLYTRARNDRERLARGYLTSLSVQSVYGVCAGVGLAVVAPVLVPLVFGQAWRPAIAPLIGLSLYASLRSLGAGANDLYKAMGRPALSVVVSLIRLVVLVPVLIVSTRWGVTGVAWAQAVCSLVFVLFMQAVASRVIQVRVRHVLSAASPALCAGAAILICAGLLVSMPIASVPALVVAVAGGAVTALVVFVLGFPSLTNEMQGLLLQRAGGPKGSRAPQHARWAPRQGSERRDIA
jgi:PST family polysaccharide transporter